MDQNTQVQEGQEEKDRTAQQFEKLTTSNQELKAERDTAKQEADAAKAEAEKYKKLYDSYQQPINQAPSAQQFSNLNQQQVNQTFQSMVDENGFLDGNKLMTTLQQMDIRARQAEERAQRAEQKAEISNKTIRDREEKAAQAQVYAKYPQLNPENKEQFDPKMWKAVYNELAVKAKAGENPSDADYMKAADEVYDAFYADKDMSRQTDQQKQEKIEQKQQINAIKPVSNIQAGYYANDKEDELMQKVRAGKRGALAELLKRRNQ